ncbi:helix-turn-helix domain-containing protein [Polymorphospora sp. NPDC051019]|uniref:helix-turn-helix domain-containing protein n=1 Tax=Polymorphospora sp. NPDC051019 TaxID=3155725 RepID=UPI0034227CBE
MRSRIVLACAEGASNVDVATELGVHLSTVGKWRRRFLKLRLDGLIDEQRPGRPASIGLDRVEDVVAAGGCPRRASPYGPATSGASRSAGQSVRGRGRAAPSRSTVRSACSARRSGG